MELRFILQYIHSPEYSILNFLDTTYTTNQRYAKWVKFVNKIVCLYSIDEPSLISEKIFRFLKPSIL